MSLGREPARADFKTVSHVTTQGAPLTTAGSFVTEAGAPGTQAGVTARSAGAVSSPG
ncbi:hypothetical protein STENM223S_08544 [Streptomyces tendae]